MNLLDQDRVYIYKQNNVSTADLIDALKTKKSYISVNDGSAHIGSVKLVDIFLNEKIVKELEETYPEEYKAYKEMLNRIPLSLEESVKVANLCVQEAIKLDKGETPEIYIEYTKNKIYKDKEKDTIVFSLGTIDLKEMKINYN